MYLYHCYIALCNSQTMTISARFLVVAILLLFYCLLLLYIKLYILSFNFKCGTEAPAFCIVCTIPCVYTLM